MCTQYNTVSGMVPMDVLLPAIKVQEMKENKLNSGVNSSVID